MHSLTASFTTRLHPQVKLKLPPGERSGPLNDSASVVSMRSAPEGTLVYRLESLEEAMEVLVGSGHTHCVLWRI